MAVIKAYQKNELAALYGVSYHTFLSWLDPFIKSGELEEWQRAKWYCSPKVVAKIFDLLGEPNTQ